MMVRHAGDPRPNNDNLKANAVADETIAKALRDANVPVNGLMVKSVGGVVVVRGSGDKAAVDQVLQRLNVTRVANLVTGHAYDDEAIRRQAERQLAGTRALDGCTLHVSCNQGVLLVTGTVQSALQIDAAREVLRTLDGVRQLKIELGTAIASAVR